MVQNKIIDINDLVMFRELIEYKSKTYLNEAENKSQVAYLFAHINLSLAILLIQMKKDMKIINMYISSAKKYLDISLQNNPFSIDTRMLYSYFLAVLNSDGRFNK